MNETIRESGWGEITLVVKQKIFGLLDLVGNSFKNDRNCLAKFSDASERY